MTPNKYHAKKTKIDGILFDSYAEAKYYIGLKILRDAGEILTIECHPKYIFQPAYRKCCGHIWLVHPENGIKGATICGNCGKKMKAESALYYEADFRVTYADGHQEVVDVKGVRTRAFERSRKMFEYRYPHLTLKIVDVH